MDDKKCCDCGVTENIITTNDGVDICHDCAEWCNDGPIEKEDA